MAKQTTALSEATYVFSGKPVRVVTSDETLWFMEWHVASALNLSGNAVEWAALSRRTIAGAPYIEWVGVFLLIGEAEASVAEDFKKWLAKELMPRHYRDSYIDSLRARIAELEALTGASGTRTPNRHLTLDERRQIVALREMGWTIQGLARRFVRGDETIRAVLKRGA